MNANARWGWNPPTAVSARKSTLEPWILAQLRDEARSREVFLAKWVQDQLLPAIDAPGMTLPKLRALLSETLAKTTVNGLPLGVIVDDETE